MSGQTSRSLVALLAMVVLATPACSRDEPATAPADAMPATAPAPPASESPPLADAAWPLLDVAVATDTLATLRARHGDANVVTAKVPGAEGEEFDGWLLFPDDATRRVYVYLDDAGAHPTLLRLLDRESRWRRPDGIHMGVTLTELAQRNGAPVGFTGFDWDYGGSCCDWNDGKLVRDPPTGGMTLCPPETPATAEPGYPMGDAQFDSDHPWVKAHPPTVCEFSLSLEPPAPSGQETPP